MLGFTFEQIEELANKKNEKVSDVLLHRSSNEKMEDDEEVEIEKEKEESDEGMGLQAGGGDNTDPLAHRVQKDPILWSYALAPVYPAPADPHAASDQQPTILSCQ